MIKPKAPRYGAPTYPSPTATGNMKRIGVTPLLRCVQCGFVNDTRRTAYAEKGDGLSELPGGDTGEQQVTAGCANCGSLKWRPTKPPVYPDDERIPDGTIKKRRR